MKLKLIAFVAAAASIGLASAASAASIVVFNTGVDALGTPQANNSAETHYSLVGQPAGANTALRVATSANGFPIGPWLGDNSLSAWIGPAGSSDLTGPAGSYTYRTTFSLAGLNASTASLSGRWSTDDSGLDILINGVSTGMTNGNGFTGWSSFSIASGFVAGVNTLDFIVSNGGGPTGLRVELTGTADVLTSGGAVPEPATWALMIGGFGAAGTMLRRRRATALA